MFGTSPITQSDAKTYPYTIAKGTPVPLHAEKTRYLKQTPNRLRLGVLTVLFLLRECVLRLVARKLLSKGCTFPQFSGFERIEIFMGFQLALGDL